MKTLLLALLLPFFLQAQILEDDLFVGLTNPDGTILNGGCMVRGFEKEIEALTMTSGSGKTQTQITFTMPINSVSANLKKFMTNGTLLPSGIITIANPSQTGMTTRYTITLEDAQVIACHEMTSCNNATVTTVTLDATRIGWTYYDTNRSGVVTISSKYGYDKETGKDWDNF